MSQAPLEPANPNAKELNLTVSALVNPEDATPMMRQFLEVKREYPGVTLFYRMGDFYETFFEDAVIAARALEITLTSRESGKLGRIPMAGVPAKAVDGYMQRLLEKNFKVAICEQMEDPALAKGLVERRVTRVLSPGTVADQRFLKANQNNFLAAIFEDPKRKTWGLAYCDITTGEFYATDVDEIQLHSELDRIKPSELLVVGRKQKGVVVDEWVPAVSPRITESYAVSPLRPDAFDRARGTARILRWFGIQDLASFGLDTAQGAPSAIGAILGYLEETYVEETRPLFEPIRLYTLSNRLEMHAATRRHLELTQTVKDGRLEGSLLWVLDKTLTSMGGRLIRQWVAAPSVNLMEITSRLDTVEALIGAPQAREALLTLLPQVYDLERLGARLMNLTAMPRDLVALAKTCAVLPQIAHALQGLEAFYLENLQTLPEAVSQFEARVSAALLESPAITLKEGGLFKTGFHEELDSLHQTLNTQTDWLTNYEQTERERTGIRTLKLGMNNAFGYYIEISKALANQAPPEYQRKQTLTGAERYITPQLKAHEDKVFSAQNTVFTLEYELYVAFRESLLPFAPVLKDLAQKVAALDVLLAFAQVSVAQQYTRPQLDDSTELVLHEARHPVIESLLPFGSFVSNDCHLSASPQDHSAPQLMIITGPNMAGKSTYMRQAALIVVMAQMGCFVPSAYARIGLVDQLFTRIGAVDDLSSGQSTFMVEMTETAFILNTATPKSLVLLDEVGRGTSTYDGVAIAWSVAEHLVRQNQSRTLFATHYHELNTLEQLSPKIQNVRVLVSETEGEIAFLHRVAPGAAQKSYGIQVAKMAGLPSGVIQQAERLLSRMQEKELTVVDKQRQAALLKTAQDAQLSLF